MKLRVALLVSLFLPILSWGQISLVQIQNIQGWAGQFQPDTCNDGPNPVYLNDTVRVRGVVITNGGLNETTGQTRWIWIRDVTASPETPFGNITVRASGATAPIDINTLVSGDTIEVTAVVAEFQGTNAGNGETQLTPIPNGVQLISEEAGPAPQPYLVSVGQLNGALNTNNNPSNNISSGEKLEGNFVEIQNVQVVNVDLSTADRCRILVKDAAGNHIWIYDRFKTQRISAGFVPPNVGDSYTSVRGMIEGWKNGCPGNANGNRGYNLNPFSLSHYVKGASSPAIGNVRKSKACPSSSDAITISADVTDDGSVTSVEVLYSTNGNTYTPVAATALGTRYSATIPAQSNGTLVRYYFRAKDNLNNTTVQPNVPGNTPALFYAVNGEGCTIKDIQFTPFTNGRSGYVGDTVTLRGIITASSEATNLGYVYMQQRGINAWGGLWVTGGTLITSLAVGDSVELKGNVEEYFGLTRLANVSSASVIVPAASTTPIVPTVVNPADFSTYDFAKCEKYEGMLVKLENPVAGQNLFVVDSNADAANGQNNGEYRVGADINDPNAGCRVLAGRQNSTAFSSLNVSYVNSTRWLTQDGTMNVPLALVIPEAPVLLMQGVLTFSFSNMKLLPRNNSDATITVGTKEILTGKQFGMYPNPAKDQMTLRFSDSQIAGSISVFNSQGQLMVSQDVNGEEADVQLSRLVSGLYRVQIKTRSGEILGIRNLAVVK
ncbi:MAG TPA: T9SS type A sorting domain-containing protein [Catalimonadaceae bacterium]|nr:T9SS type A sorting domain-containing protein [Catalimonadaceae bacterium]